MASEIPWCKLVCRCLNKYTMKLKTLALIGATGAIIGCTPSKKQYESYADYPVPSKPFIEMEYAPQATHFTLWAPTADEVRLLLYKEGDGGHAYETVAMQPAEEGLWTTTVTRELKGEFYTFNVKVNNHWLGETPGISARAVGVNGKRGAIIDFADTNPQGWEDDQRPELRSTAQAIVYEMHHRDFSISPTAGSSYPGKFLALTETGTHNLQGAATGIDHLKELGVTHVHLLPSYDFASIDESALENNAYNWGYDPLNYNVPEGSYSTDPYTPTTRIREFKQMVQALHQAGIRVVMDVVYNHTFNIERSNFQRTVPGYFYRQRSDGTPADASGCGNETASDRPMMRKFMVESILYWMREYHIDGFRFDLMGIHDIETMNIIADSARCELPTVLIYGEGWAASAPQLPVTQLATKANTHHMHGIAAFSDELRDALRGPFNDDTKGAFLAGIPGMEESIKFGIAGAISHPQICYDSVNYSTKPWAAQPTQMISYVSCHDDMCLTDRLHASIPELTTDVLVRLDKLAQTAVFTSQGIPFIQAGEEVLRDKKGVHNSYNSPDSINAIDWSRKSTHTDLVNYYRGLINLRHLHPAFRLGDAELVRKHLEFLPVDGNNLVAYRLKDHAGGDSCRDIIVVLNARTEPATVAVPQGDYTVLCHNGRINPQGLGTIAGTQVRVSPQSALIICR